jgi:hypothetical protein
MHVYLIEEVESPGTPPTQQMHYTKLDTFLDHAIENLHLRNTPSLLFTHRKLNVHMYVPQDPTANRR